jgi:NAD+ kinase
MPIGFHFFSTLSLIACTHSHAQLPAILFTPICPHSLSFRPVVLPQNVVLKVKTTDHAASIAFDGRHRHELRPGDSLMIRVSRYPFPTITKTSQTAEWIQSISRHLNWNRRARQKAKADDATGRSFLTASLT